MVDHLDPHVPAFKIGSGDINWPEMLEKVARKGKPVLLSTGASTLREVEEAVDIITRLNKKLVLMQCNTNYTGSISCAGQEREALPADRQVYNLSVYDCIQYDIQRVAAQETPPQAVQLFYFLEQLGR